MSTAKELNQVFDQAEELVGTYPSSEGLRSAIHAVITKNMDLNRANSLVYRVVGSSTIMNNVEYLARNYEASRGVHMHMGGGCTSIKCNNPS